MSGNKRTNWFLRLFKVGLLIVVIINITIYAMRDNITDKVLGLAEARLAEDGFYLKHGSHELSWTRGVVLKGLSLYSDKERRSRIAVFENVGIRIPLMEWFSRDAKLIFSSDHGFLKIETTAGNLQLNDLNFELIGTREALDLARCEATMTGLHVIAGGGFRWVKSEKRRKGRIPDLAPVVKAASWLEFSGEKPTLVLRLESRDQGKGGLGLSGELNGEHFRWRGLAFDRAKARIVVEGGRVEMPAVTLDCYGGKVSGALTVDPKAGKLEVSKVRSSAKPFRLTEAIMGGSSLRLFHVLGETVMSGENITFDLREFSKSTGTFALSSPDGFVVPVDKFELPLTDFHGELRFEEGKLVVHGQRFAFHGGGGKGIYTMPLSGDFRYDIKADLQGVSLEPLGRALGLKKDLVGTMRASFDGGGRNSVKAHYGNCRVEVADGKFYAIPLYGSLRALLAKKSSRFGLDEARDLSATLILKDGSIHSSDFRVENASTMVVAHGGADLVRKTLDVKVRANLKGVEGVATSVLSRALEVEGKGSFDHVHWSMVMTPDGVVKDTAEEVGHAVKDVEKAAEGILEKGPGLLFPKKKEPK